jgi:membrane protease YdiL (CAAX protease family)
LLVGIIAVSVFTVLAYGISLLLSRDQVNQFQLDLYRSASAASWLPWLLLTVVVVAPIGEETLFRGFLFRGWHRSDKDAWAVIIVIALLWALIHLQYDLYDMAQVFAYGLLLGWLRWKTGSTILTILLHGLINFGGLVETFIAVHQ